MRGGGHVALGPGSGHHYTAHKEGHPGDTLNVHHVAGADGRGFRLTDGASLGTRITRLPPPVPHTAIVGSMLVQRRRRWANIEPTMDHVLAVRRATLQDAYRPGIIGACPRLVGCAGNIRPPACSNCKLALTRITFPFQPRSPGGMRKTHWSGDEKCRE